MSAPSDNVDPDGIQEVLRWIQTMDHSPFPKSLSNQIEVASCHYERITSHLWLLNIKRNQQFDVLWENLQDLSQLNADIKNAIEIRNNLDDVQIQLHDLLKTSIQCAVCGATREEEEVKAEGVDDKTTFNNVVGATCTDDSLGLNKISDVNTKDEDVHENDDQALALASRQRMQRVDEFNSDIVKMEEEFTKLQIERFRLAWQDIE